MPSSAEQPHGRIGKRAPVTDENYVRAHTRTSPHGIQGAWVKEEDVAIDNGNIVGYRVDLKVTFILD